MTKNDCINILYTMSCGSSTVEKEAVQYVENVFKKAKEAKRWKRKYKSIIRCKDCRFFERDHVKTAFGVPVITAHEVCNKWGEGCKTNENGFCFLAERGNEQNDNT